MYNKSHKLRLVSVSFFLVLFLLLIFCRIFFIQIISADTYQRIADSQHKTTITLPALRGAIYDRNMHELAGLLNANSLYGVCRDIIDKEAVAKKLSLIFEKDAAFYLERLNRDKMFVWLERKIPYEKEQMVKDLKLDSLGLIKEGKRFYPNGILASQVIGFSNIDNTGIEGLELRFDKYLKGEDGLRSLLRDAKRRYIPAYEYKYIEPKNGKNLVLTIDQVIQYIAEASLNKIYKKYRANGASIIVMDPNNGNILALANCPGYDLNNFSAAGPEQFRNRAICDIFEPGSVFKIVTASAALEEGVVKLTDKFFCENGAYAIGGRILHDHTPHGWLTFKEVIEKSSNIGTVKVAQRLGGDKLYNYIKIFGFGEPTGIELTGEVAGINKSPKSWSKTSMTVIPMGQEVAVTALQLAGAVSVIANGGNLIKPRIVDKIIDDKKEIIEEFKPEFRRRVISETTAKKMRDILKGVVETGTGQAGAVTGYSAGGKTGTAQKIEPNGTYSHSRFMSSFIGFAPATNPKVVIVVIVDEPKFAYYGGVVAAPVFKEVAGKTLKYMNVPEDNPKLAKN